MVVLLSTISTLVSAAVPHFPTFILRRPWTEAFPVSCCQQIATVLNASVLHSPRTICTKSFHPFPTPQGAGMSEGAAYGEDLSALNLNLVISEQEALVFKYLEICRYRPG